MRPLLLILCFASLTFPAMAEPVNLPATMAQWQNLRDPDASGIAFAEGVRFLTEHPGWPDEKIIRLRTEAAALFERPDRKTMASFCADDPLSGRGMFACIHAQARDEPTRKQWLHQGWIQGDFTETEERSILAEFGQQLTVADHVARIDRLLYEQKTAAAKRDLPILSVARRPLFLARIAVLQHDRHAKKLIAALPIAEQHNPGLLYDRASTSLEARKTDALVAFVAAAPANAPYPELWWPARNIAIREALSTRNYKTALTILNDRGTLKGEQLAEALWLKGWLTLEYKHDPANAYKEFHTLYTQVTTPVSRSRAAYWASRAARQNGNQDIAHEWLIKAANYPTVFYGQLAYQALSPDTPLTLPDAPDVTADDRTAFNNDELISAVRLLNNTHDTQLRDRFLLHIASTSADPARLLLLANLAKEMDGLRSSVKVAKLALRKQVVLIDRGWPKIGLPVSIGVEPALALGISRQESEFDIHAQSAANAHGLMQLLPATARHIAARIGAQYRADSLENPAENLTLGTAYLGLIIHGFDGSYILGIASYNAGPASVRHWLTAQGPLPKTLDGSINWIESIPYSETRNYVMRVLENMEIYRTLQNPAAPLRLNQDLIR